MKKMVLALMMILPFAQAQANQDLVLESERWLAKFTAYVCADGNTQVATPAELASKNVVFTTASADYSLDNILLKATFEENGAVCRYSTLLFADNTGFTIKLVESKAFSEDGSSDCAAGKAALDTLLAFNPYKYLHGRAAVYVPVADAAALCGADTVGIHLQVTGRVQ